MKFFLTGTGTGVGKTTIGCALLAAWRARNRPCVALKPIETGCHPTDGPADATALWNAQGGRGPVPSWVCRYRYRRAASAEAAAQTEGAEPPDLNRLAEDWRAYGTPASGLALSEGAGGLLAPIAPGLTACDLIERLQLPVVVVGTGGLGTINHTLLTVQTARSRGLTVLGFVLNDTQPGAPGFTDENADAIAAHGRVSCLGRFPHVAKPDLATLAPLAEQHLAALIT